MIGVFGDSILCLVDIHKEPSTNSKSQRQRLKGLSLIRTSSCAFWSSEALPLRNHPIESMHKQEQHEWQQADKQPLVDIRSSQLPHSKRSVSESKATDLYVITVHYRFRTCILWSIQIFGSGGVKVVRCFDLVWLALAAVAHVTLSSLHFPISRRTISTFSMMGKISVLTGMRSQGVSTKPGTGSRIGTYRE
jgi:hypothetical protein